MSSDNHYESVMHSEDSGLKWAKKHKDKLEG